MGYNKKIKTIIFISRVKCNGCMRSLGLRGTVRFRHFRQSCREAVIHHVPYVNVRTHQMCLSLSKIRAVDQLVDRGVWDTQAVGSSPTSATKRFRSLTY